MKLLQLRFVLPLVLVATGAFIVVAWATERWPFEKPVSPPPPENTKVEGGTVQAATLEDGLKIMHEARAQFGAVKDYRCLFLRDEVMPKGMVRSQIKLRVRHEPFSVFFDYVKPDDEQAVYHAKDNKVFVKRLIVIPLDPNSDRVKQRSKNSPAEAGLLNALNRFCRRWEEEKQLGLTEVKREEDVQLKLRVDGEDRDREFRCTVFTTLHDPKHRERFEKEIKLQFYRTVVYLDKQTGLPFRMEGYSWPTEQHPDGELMESYTYLDMKTNVGLTDQDFVLK